MDTLSSPVGPPPMTASERELWRGAVEARWGVYFSDARMYRLRARIWERMQAHSLNTSAAYYRLLTESGGRAEWQALLESALNNETRFFRHPPSFAVLGSLILPEIAARKARGADGEGVAIWSAACSTGQEAYSLALAAAASKAAAALEVTVEGTDISERALEQARAGVYGPRAVANVPEELLERYFRVVETGGRQRYQVRPRLRSLVRFRYGNLCGAAPERGFDVVFCQNVLIYFRQPMRDRILGSLAGCVNPGGFLMLAPGELPQPRIAGLKAVPLSETTVFQRDA